MKVIAINGSPRAKGNTHHALRTVLGELEKQGIETELLQVGHLKIRGCTACFGCGKVKNKTCVIDADINEIIAKMAAADGIILGSPVFFSGIAGTMKCFLDRAFYVSLSNGNLFRHKIGASMAVARRAGAVTVFDQLNKYFTISQMPVVSSQYWNAAYGAKPEEVADDVEGLQIARVLGQNMAYELKLRAAGKGIEPPAVEPKTPMNFIR